MKTSTNFHVDYKCNIDNWTFFCNESAERIRELRKRDAPIESCLVSLKSLIEEMMINYHHIYMPQKYLKP